MRSRGTPEQGRDLGSVLWALRWTQRLREQLVQCEAPHVLKVKDLKETGSQNLGHPEAWACFRQCGRPGARTSRTWWPLGTPARAAAGWASLVWVSGLRAPGCGGHGRPLCPACCRPWTCPTPQVLLALGLMRDCAVAETRGLGGTVDGDPGAGRAPRGLPATAASFSRRLRGEDLCHPPRSHVACPVSAAWGPREPVRGEAAGSPRRAGEVVAPRRLAGPLPVTAPPCGPPVGRGAGRCLRRRGWREGRPRSLSTAEDAAGGAERVDGGGRVCGASGEELPGPGRRCHVPGPPGRHHPLCPGAVPSAAQRPPGRPPGQEPPLRVCGVLSSPRGKGFIPR